MNNTNMHSKNNLTRYIVDYIIVLIPLILFGLYKNGIVPYINKSINLVQLFRPLVIPMLGYLISTFISLIFASRRKEVITKSDYLSLSGIYGAMIGMLVMPNISVINFMVIIFILSIIYEFTKKRINYNIVALGALVFMIFGGLVKDITFLNNYETNAAIYYSYLDKIVGFNIGGLSSTSNILVLIGFGYLILRNNIKWDIPLYVLISYLVLGIIYALLGEGLTVINLLLNNSSLFIIVIVSSISAFSPYRKRSKLIYGILLGISSFFLSFYVSSAYGILIPIFVISVFSRLIDRINL